MNIYFSLWSFTLLRMLIEAHEALIRENIYAVKVCLCLYHCFTRLGKRKKIPSWKTFSMTLHCLQSRFDSNCPPIYYQRNILADAVQMADICTLNVSPMSHFWTEICVASVMVFHWGGTFFRTSTFLGPQQKRRA